MDALLSDATVFEVAVHVDDSEDLRCRGNAEAHLPAWDLMGALAC